MKPIAVPPESTGQKLALYLSVSVLAAALIGYSLSLFGVIDFNFDDEITVSNQVPAPGFSHSSGFYQEEFELELSGQNPDSEIYFTLDGSIPSIQSERYSRPILIKNRQRDPNILADIPTSLYWDKPLERVFKGTLVRAIEVAGKQQSHETQATFFVHEKGHRRYTLPKVVLIVNYNDFFGPKGLYVRGNTFNDKDYFARKIGRLDTAWWGIPGNFLRRGENWERPARIEFYENDNTPSFAINAGVRVHGGASRALRQKSLRILFNKKYGPYALNYKLFDNVDKDKFKALLLRSAGNDQPYTMFRDALIQSLVSETTKLDVQASKPVIAFINSEYWGIHNIRERMDQDYLALKYSLPADSVYIHTSVAEAGKDSIPGFGDGNVVDFINKNSIKEAHNYKRLSELIDIDNFIDYVIAEIYSGNNDWPANNVKMWRYSSKSLNNANLHRDGRWRFLFFDLDFGFGPDFDDNKTRRFRNNKAFVSLLFNKLLQNPEFREKYISRFELHLTTSFKTERVLQKIDEFEAIFEPEMQEHINRWRNIRSIKEWKKNVEVLRQYAINRPAYQRQELEEIRAEFKGNN